MSDTPTPLTSKGATPGTPPRPTPSVRRSRLLGLGVVLLLAATAVAWLPRTQPANQPGAAIVFRISPPTGLLEHRSMDAAEFDQYRLEQAAAVRSQVVLNRTVNDLQGKDVPLLASHPDRLGWLTDNLRVTFAPSPAFMRVELNGDPDQAVAILEALAAAYLAEVDRVETGQRDHRIKALERVRHKHEDLKKALRAHARTLAQAAGMSSPRDRVRFEAAAADEIRACAEGLRRVRHLRAGYRVMAPGAADADRILDAWERLWQADLAATRERLSQLDLVLDELAESDRKLRLADEALARLEAAVAEAAASRDAPLRVTVFEPAHVRPAPK